MMNLILLKTLNQLWFGRKSQNRILNKSEILVVWLQLDLNIGQQILNYILPFVLSSFPQMGRPQLECL